MSSILNELRLIEAKRVSGALSDAEFKIQKSALLDDIPEAFESEVVEGELADKFTAKPTKSTATLWDTLLLWVAAATVCGTATWAITGSLRMASTLGITVLAAFTIKLFTALE